MSKVTFRRLMATAVCIVATQAAIAQNAILSGNTHVEHSTGMAQAYGHTRTEAT